jgi:predicted AlkP superfamily phosphohydrolase/phosphomutase
MNSSRYKKAILLGMDGLDPRLLIQLMKQGALPNFSALKDRGAFHPLATCNPAQSPVAWSSIATGSNPGYHGIFDFLGRRVHDYIPELAILKINPKNPFGKREAMFLPVMHGNTFWDYTSENNIPSTVLKWPMTFQPKQNKTNLYAGLGVPDIKGGLGRYSFYTTRDIHRGEDGSEKVIKIKVQGQKIKTYVPGPNITKLMSRDVAKADLLIQILPDDSGIEININGKKTALRPGVWSEWIDMQFNLGLMRKASGIVKFYLNRISPEFELYMTPVQINPKDPAFVISSPDEYVKELAKTAGCFYTLGMPEDTKSLEEGKIDEEAFIAMCDEIIEEQEKMLWYELDRFKEGLLASAFFSTDRIQHIFWVTKDPQHPLYDEKYAQKYGHVIDDYYRKMDKILGEVMKQADDKTSLLVFSDHGFSSFRRTVHLNSWLVQNGFMTLTQRVSKDDKEGGGLFQYVDWTKTQAYALGFGSIYLNLKEREGKGIVERGSAEDALSYEIAEKLVKLTDQTNGKQVVRNVYKSNEIYSGPQINASPDLVVGFQNCYRASWQTAVGGSPAEIIEDNLKKWTGDHIMDPVFVPGILLANFKLSSNSPSIMDIAPTVLSCFGMTPANIDGKSLI